MFLCGRSSLKQKPTFWNNCVPGTALIFSVAREMYLINLSSLLRGWWNTGSNDQYSSHAYFCPCKCGHTQLTWPKEGWQPPISGERCVPTILTFRMCPGLPSCSSNISFRSSLGACSGLDSLRILWWFHKYCLTWHSQQPLCEAGQC